MNIHSIINTVKDNQLLLAGLGMSGAGLFTFWIKDVPKGIFNYAKRMLTTNLTMTSQNLSYHHALRWIERNYKDKNFRHLKLTNGRWGYNDQTVTSIGYGVHYIRFKKHLFLINLTKETANQSEYDKETIVLTKMGRSRKIFDEFVKEISKVEEDFNKTKLYKMEDSWTYVKDQKKRSLNSVFIEKGKKDMLINTLQRFIDNEQWYIDNGIPYQLGILLYGAPGTGKTSLIKAIAGYLNYPIYYISPQKLPKIEQAMSTLSDKCIVVIEDIDSNTMIHSRDKNDNSPKTEEDTFFENFAKEGLSEILNSLDGMFSAHGRILITTTNHVEKLDAALIRPGRIDLKVEIGYVNNEIFNDFINNFYPENKIDISDVKLKDNLTVAILQNMVLQGKTVDEIIEEVRGDS